MVHGEVVRSFIEHLATQAAATSANVPAAHGEWLFVSTEQAISDSPESADGTDFDGYLRCLPGPDLEFVPTSIQEFITQNSGNADCPRAPAEAQHNVEQRTPDLTVLHVKTRKPGKCHATISAKIFGKVRTKNGDKLPKTPDPLVFCKPG